MCDFQIRYWQASISAHFHKVGQKPFILGPFQWGCATYYIISSKCQHLSTQQLQQQNSKWILCQHKMQCTCWPKTTSLYAERCHGKSELSHFCQTVKNLLWVGNKLSWSSPHCARWGHSFPPEKRGQSPPIFGQSLLCPNSWMHQDAMWYGGRPQSRRLCVTWGPSPYLKKGGAPPNFRPTSIVPNGCMDQDATCYRGRPRPAYATLCSMWTQLPPEKRAHPPHPIFGPSLLWPNGWMDEDAAWYGSRPRAMPHCTRWGPSFRERGTAAPSFRPMSIVVTVAISATAELLLEYLNIN